MKPTYALLSLALCAPVAQAADETFAVDLLGGAAFTENYITLGIAQVNAEARDSNQEFTAIQIGMAGYSVSGYKKEADSSSGFLLGAGVLARSWIASDNGVDWQGLTPFAVLTGGAFVDPGAHLRLSLTGEAGPGLAFQRVEAGGQTDSQVFKPALHLGMHATLMGRMNPSTDIGIILGYEYDRLPDITVSGPLIGLALKWHGSNAAAGAE
ncbi:MAG TPA: hypothetical protein DCS97_14980 [Planctomycetes bacterium]|nr:hypothetical protein [Planctomycetota bacterium]